MFGSLTYVQVAEPLNLTSIQYKTTQHKTTAIIMRQNGVRIAIFYLLHTSTNAFLTPPATKSSSSVLSVSVDRELDDDILEVDDVQAVNQPRAIRRKLRPKKIPLIAVLGRPNVGKSALVNRICGTQSGGAIVADESGITRDRTYRPAEFLGERFQVVSARIYFFLRSQSIISQ